MRLDTVAEGIDFAAAGARMHDLAARLYPICRSLTGPGVRETLDALGGIVPLERHEIPTGTVCFDWEVPREWSVRDAWIKNAKGEKVVDFKAHNLHLMGYSTPVRATMDLAELRPRLHSLPDHPDWIPYRTAYYKDNWGFSLKHSQLAALPEGRYEVCIDSELKDGSLSYGECFLPGRTHDEVLLFVHICHPSLANDNLSGMAVATELAQALDKADRRYGYRIVFCPSVLGAIAWLHANEANLSRIRHGMTLALLGDPAGMTYKRSRDGDAHIDRAAAHVLAHGGGPHAIKDFTPYGYDERQFCSPGFNLPVGCLMRSPNGTFPEYHSSGDNLDFIKAEAMADSLKQALGILAVLEGDGNYQNLNPKCEPRLGKRGIFEGLKGKNMLGDAEFALLWVLNQSDGSHSLLAIAEKAGIPFAAIRRAADVLENSGLLAPAGSGPSVSGKP